MQKKIIHFFPRGKLKANFPKKDSPYFFLVGWPSLQARSTLKYSNEYKVEVWRTDENIKTFKSKNVEGIECKLYPIKKKKYIHLSLFLIRDLMKEFKKNNVLLNLHKIHTLETTLLCILFGKHPIVLHHHGSIPYEFRENKSIVKNIYWKILTAIDKRVLKRIDFFSVISVIEKNYLANFIDPQKIRLEQGRRYFDEWKPLNKLEAKIKLGIALNKKVIIYIGYYYKLKGVDNLLYAYKELKKKYDLELIMIGGHPTDPLYDQVIESGAKDFAIIPNNELNLYLSAADVYCAAALDGTWVKFGGISTAIIEALACNVPVVSRQLIHFPTDEWKKIGEIPETIEDVISGIEKIFKHPENYSARETAKKYYDFEVIIKDNIVVYNNLFKKYSELN